MKQYSSNLTQRFIAFRSAQRLGLALASLSTLRAVQTLDDRDANRRIAALVSERQGAMNDCLTHTDGITVSRFERDETARGRGFESLLTTNERNQLRQEWQPKRAAVTTPLVVSREDALPDGFSPAIVEEYQPAIDPTLDAIVLAELAFEESVANRFPYLALMA